MPVSSSTEHWIKPDALTIKLNHFGDPDYLQVSVLAGAVVMAFKQDVISYNAAHNYRTWPLQAANTYLETSSAYHVYARLTRSEVNASALIVYDPVLRDINGCEISTAEGGGEILGEADENYYFVYLGSISSSINASGVQVQRTWNVDFRFGTLSTNQYLNEESAGGWSKMFRLNKVTDMIDVLKEFSSAVFHKLFIRKKEITDIHRSKDNDLFLSDEILPTTKYVDEKYLRKDQDDRSVGLISSDKGFEVGKFVTGASGAIIFEDAKTGQTVAELDKLYVRMKAYFETLEIINVNSVGGKMILSPAGSINCIGVEETEDAYRCYFLGEQDGELIENRFEVGDQAYSEMFNAKEGVSNKVSNIYYWRYVSGISENAVEYNGKKCHYIELSKFDCDEGSDIPKAGDVINHRGSRYDTDRMNFVEFSSVGVNAPYITLFQGVGAGETPYSLVGKEYVQFGYNQMTGKAFMHVYGDMYVGARDESSYLKYTPEDGLEVCGTISVRSKLSDGRILADELESLGVDMEKIKRQTDQEYMIWFENHEPTLDNKPAVDWTTDELKAEHDQDLLYYREQGKAWRFEGGVWKEITDQDVLRALELIAKTQKDVDDLGYLKRALQNAPETEIENGLVMTSLMAVRNDKGEVESFLNGSTLGEHETYGKLLLAGGIPERNGQTTDLSERAKKACTRIYEDGSLISKTISFDTLEVDANGYYVLPPINGKHGMFYMDSVVGVSRVAQTKTFISANDENIVRITGASSVEETKSISISNQDTIMLFSCQDSTGADMWSAVVLPYWIYGRQASDSINVATVKKITSEEEATDPTILYILS